MVPSTEKHIGFLGRLLLWQKLALLVAATAVPAIVLGCLYFQQTAAAARQTRSEIDGTRYIKALGSVAGELLTPRGREYSFLNGDKARRPDVIAQAPEVDKQVAAADKIDAELGEKLGVSQDWQRAKSEWATLESSGMQGSPEDSDAAHAALASHLDHIADRINDRSLTSVDPDISTRALLRIASNHAPDLMIYSSNMRRHAVRAASKGYLGGDDRMGIRIFRDRQQAELDSLKGALEQVSPEVRATIQESVTAAQATADEFFGIVQAKILNAANMEISGSAIYDAGVATNRAWKKVSLSRYDALTKAVEQRLARTNQQRLITATATALALCLALGLSLLVTRSLSRPLHHAVSVFGRISAGNYDNEITVSGTDEASQVLSALDRMPGTLRTHIETERAVAAENSRIRHALDKASTSVVLADGQHRIIYLNDTAQMTFGRAQAQILKTLPGFDAQRVRGSNLDALSSDPAHERRMLDALTGSEVQERTLGSLTFRIVTSPVSGEKGERIGTVMEWTDRTQEVGVEKEMQTMLSAVIDGDLASRIALDRK